MLNIKRALCYEDKTCMNSSNFLTLLIYLRVVIGTTYTIEILIYLTRPKFREPAHDQTRLFFTQVCLLIFYK